MDDDGSKSLDIEEFKKGIHDCGLSVEPKVCVCVCLWRERCGCGLVVSFQGAVLAAYHMQDTKQPSLLTSAMSIADGNCNGYIFVKVL